MATAPGWRPGVVEALYAHACGAAAGGSAAGVLVGRLPSASAPMDVVGAIALGDSRRPILDASSWQRVESALHVHYAGSEVVGWYVSRPGAGTDAHHGDILAHQSWFPGPRVLLVLDPTLHAGALYVGSPAGLHLLHQGPLDAGVATAGVAAAAAEAEAEAAARWPRGATLAAAVVGVLLGLLIWLAAGADAGVLAARTP
ncbi:MAG TPA: hypothetical protein VF549_10775 [Solirubrobacteraceae bacterium]|jgi:proteasome lid subunit RPN8/RPN11